MTDDISIIVLGRKTAAMFVLELRKHGICAAWGFQHLLLDLETFAQRVWRERGRSVHSLLHGYGSGVLAVSPYAGLGSCRERIGADMHEALVKPTVHMAIFIDEMPKPLGLIGNKADRLRRLSLQCRLPI